MKTKMPFILCCLLLGFRLPAEEDKPFLFTTTVNWEKAEMVLTIESPVSQTGINLAAAEFSSERKIDQAMPGIFLKAAGPLLVDSFRTVQDFIEKDNRYSADLLRAAGMGKKGFPRFSSTLNRVSIDYTYPLHSLLGSLFISHQTPAEVPRDILWSPSAQFTGVVIYTAETLPVHGEIRSAILTPCMFPEIFNEDMDPVLLNGMGNPEFLARWGSAAYSRTFDEKLWEERVGKTPLRIVAAGLFGKHPTDIIIRNTDARRLLSRPENRRLLAEGRILIIAPSLN